MLLKIVLTLGSFFLIGQALAQWSPELILQSPPQGHISELKVTQDGRYLLSIGAANSLKAWDLKTYRLLFDFHDHDKRIHTMDITADGRYVVTGGDDHWIVLTDLHAGQAAGKYDLGEAVCRVAMDGPGTIYALTRSGTLYQIDAASGIKTRRWSKNCHLWAAAFDIGKQQLLLMPDNSGCNGKGGFELLSLGTGELINRIDYNQGKFFNTRWVKYIPELHTLVACEVELAPQNRIAPGSAQLWIWHSSSNDWQRIPIAMRVEDISVYAEGQLLLSGPDDGLAIYDLQARQIRRRIQKIQLSPYLRTHLKPYRHVFLAKEGIVVTAMHDINIIDLAEERMLRIFTQNTFGTRDARLTADGKYWYCSSYNKSMLISTSNGRITYDCPRFKIGFLSPDGTRRVVSARNGNGQLHLLDLSGRDTLWSSPPQQSACKAVSMSEDNRYIAAMPSQSTSGPEVQIWDSEAGRLLAKLPASTNQMVEPRLSKTGQYIGIGSDKDGTFIYQRMEEGGQYRLIIHHQSQQVIALAFDPQEQLAAAITSNGKVICFDLQRQTIKWNTDLSAQGMEPSQLAFSRHHLYIGTMYSGQILRLRPADGQVLQRVKAHANNIRSMSVTPDDQFMLTHGEDDLMYFRRVNDLQPILGMLFYTPNSVPDWTQTKDDYVLFTPQGYYWSFGQAYEGIGFRIENSAYPIEHFDLWYSRPDKVVEALPYPADSLLAPYRQAYRERLNNYGVKEQIGDQQIKLPRLELPAKALPKSVRERTVNIPVKAIAADYPLRRLQVYINDVPIYGSQGIVIPQGSERLYHNELKIDLSSGANKVQVSAIDGQELESLRETFYINYEPHQLKRPNLYFLSVTVSEFHDEDDNLPFAASDLDSLKALFSGAEHPVYEQVYFHALLNEQVNEEGLKGLRQILESTHIDDRVILHIATHGLRDIQNQLYLATTRTDFYEPEKNSIPYQQVIDLMDSIPARRKLVILDACRAGEYDERISAFRNQRNQPGQIIRNAGNRDWDNPYELARELFTDLRRQNGSTILVGARADEASREGSKWKMSVLMYFFTKGLREKAADQLNDGVITVSELQQYLITQVSEATQKKQNPVARVYNLSNDWQIW